MASQSATPATNELIVRLLEEVKRELADSKSARSGSPACSNG